MMVLFNKIQRKLLDFSFQKGQLFLFNSTLSHGEQFVPRNNFQIDTNLMSKLQEFIQSNRRIFVLTGAGISTESGIRDYRSEGVGLYAVSKSRPVYHQDFVKSLMNRKKYWARNYTGWPIFSSHQPNDGHYAISKLEQAGKLHWTVTQNVDTLHSKAGSKRITELHGSSNRVICLSCGNTSKRDDLQKTMDKLNPNWDISPDIATAPDGDVLLNDEVVKNFHVPDCSNCGGILKPDVVFFGDNVPRDRVQLVQKCLDESDSVLVLGSSLQVYSAFRLMVSAHEQRKPLAIVNIGPTRADTLASLKVQVQIGEIVKTLQSCAV